MIEEETERSEHTQDVHEQDLRETEELVAGFKRRRPAARRQERSDFIGYHMSKESAPRARPTGSPASRRARATVVVPRESRRAEWLVWGAIGAGMIVLGGTIAYLVNGASAAAPPSRAVTVAPPPSQPMPPSNRDIPPPPPAEDEANESPNATPPSPVRRAARARPTEPARHEQEPAAAPSTTSEYRKRDDFIRDF